MPNSVNCKSVVLLGSIHLMFGLSVTIWTVVFIIWTIFYIAKLTRFVARGLRAPPIV